MLIDIVSDLHTDLWKGGPSRLSWEFQRNEDSKILLIGGDTSNYVSEVETVLEDARQFYEHVIFTDGNHESYFFDGSVDEIEAHLQALADRMDNVTYLNGRNSIQIEDTVFLGCNGWYDFVVNEKTWRTQKVINAWKRMSNDPRMINFGNFPPDVRAIMHADLIRGKVEDLQDQSVDIVVMTHTAPHSRLNEWSKHRGTSDSLIDGAYYNTQMEQVLDADVNKRIKLWTYGHTHQRLDKMIKGVRFINNSRGYESESWERSRWFIVQADTKDNVNG